MPSVSVLNTSSQVSGKTLAVCENDQTISGAWTFSGNQTFNGNVALGNATSDTLTITSTIISHLLFTDNTYDIGASGATRPRDLFLGRNATIGGTLGVTGAATLSSTLAVTSTSTLSGNVTAATGSGGTLTLGGGANAAELRFLEPSGSGSDYVAIKAPALAASYTLTLPNTDGNANEVLKTDGSGVLSWLPGVKPSILFLATSNTPPTSNPATLDTRNNHPVLDFDASTDEFAVFGGVLPVHYASGGLTVEIYWTATSATTGDVVWNAEIERMDTGLDLDADSFAAAQAATTTCSGTSGAIVKTTITFTDGAQMDSLAAGEAFRLRISRDANNVSDTMTGDAEVHRVVIRET